jgi:hypothetical protein
MTAKQQRDVTQAQQAVRLGMPDMAARILSAAYRCAMRERDRLELHRTAVHLGVHVEADYIIC